MTEAEVNQKVQNLFKTKAPTKRVSLSYAEKNTYEDSLKFIDDNNPIYLLLATKQILFEKSVYKMDAETKKSVLQYFKSCKRKTYWKQNGLLIAFYIISGVIISYALSNMYVNHHKRKQVETKVREYEKNLPGYLEYKEQVEHYRDSLMHIYIR